MDIFPINQEYYNMGRTKILFPAKAEFGALFEKKLLVSFDWRELENKAPDLDPRRAIWCYNDEGNLLWVVELGYSIDKDGVRSELQDHIDSFSYWEKDNILVAFGRMGYRLDTETGKLGEIVYQER